MVLSLSRSRKGKDRERQRDFMEKEKLEGAGKLHGEGESDWREQGSFMEKE